MVNRRACRPRIGVLALQGDFALHRRALEEVGAEVREVRDPDDLHGLDGLVLPGGETTTMLRLMEGTGMEDGIREFARDGGAVFGTCAGLILLARRVIHPEQRALGILDADVERNAYGRQIDSFETDLPWTEDTDRIRGVFIRAPRIRDVGSGVRVLAMRDGEPVLVREGRILAATFHPELTGDTRVHRYFVEQVLNGGCPTAGAGAKESTA
jgi:5'-phosphate synthase pdxT subunit